ncbi:MAG: mechanosensitive ion channel family protein [Phycisphaerales bacterium]|jgi:MscS family membrane protein|nr:mechanosensitive ion channel family protein [Phycisphaerales bacterium]
MTVDSLGILGQSIWDMTFLGNAPWQWISLGGAILGAMVLGKILAVFVDSQADKLEAREGYVVTGKVLRCVENPLLLILLSAAMYAAVWFMNFQYVDDGGETQNLLPVWLKFTQMMLALGVGWCIYRMVDIVEHFLLHLTGKTQSQLDDQLVPLIRKTLRIIVVIMLGLFIAQNIFHWNIGTLLAGLGLGGLAFALAAKDMLSNIFGSITIFADRAFQIGDRVNIDGQDGVVEAVGFRSTKLRTMVGHVVTVPNSVVANTTVINIAARPYLKRSFDVGVTYDTSPKKLQRAIEILREMCQAREKNLVPDQKSRVYFTDFGPSSININVTYWFCPVEWEEFLVFNHDFNMELLSRFNAEGIEFAFPSQTLYLKNDSETDTDDD